MGRGMQKVNELYESYYELYEQFNYDLEDTKGLLADNPLTNSLPLNKRRRREFFKPKMFFYWILKNIFKQPR